MRNYNFLEKLLYKRKYVGKVEKEGEVYLKYKKIGRFKFLQIKSIVIILLVILLTIVYLYLINLFTSTKYK